MIQSREKVSGKDSKIGQCYKTFYGRKLHLSGAPLQGRLMVSPTNIRLDWKGLPGTNALAYYEKSLLTTVKKFYNIRPCWISFSKSDRSNPINFFCLNLQSGCAKYPLLELVFTGEAARSLRVYIMELHMCMPRTSNGL